MVHKPRVERVGAVEYGYQTLDKLTRHVEAITG
jgi:hypothetical protein